MPEVDLIITTKNQEAIKNIKDTQRAYQELNNTANDGIKKQKETVADLEKQMKQLFQEQKKGFSSIEQVNEYTRKMDDLKKKYEEVAKAEKDTTQATQTYKKSTDDLGNAATGLTKKLGPMAVAIAAITKVTGAVVAAFKDTTLGLNMMTRAGELWRQTAYNIATGNFNMTQSLIGALAVAEQANKFRVQERKDLVKAAELREKYNQLYFESADRTESDTNQLAKLNEALEIHNQLIDVEVQNIQEELSIVQQRLILRKNSNKLLDEEAKLKAELLATEGRRWSETKRIEMRRSTLENKIHDDQMERWFDEIEAANKTADERLKIQDEFNKKAEKLQDEYDKAVVAALSGEDKLKAARDYELKQLNLFREEIEALGELTPEMKSQLEFLAKQIHKTFADAMVKYGTLSDTEKESISNALLAGVKELPGLQKSFIETYESTHGGESYKGTIWDSLGLTEEEGRDVVDAFRESAEDIFAVLDDIYSRRADDAQRTRELLDDQIAETQRSLDLEIQLMEEGYANNVQAKKKEIEQLKKQREKALADEEKAVEKERMMAKIIQTGNILSGISNIIEIYSKIPVVGLVLAAAAIASLWAIWGGAKTKVASEIKLAEGGSGTDTGLITGKSHAGGGEHFLDHVEVEHGEAFGVLSRKATNKYGPVFHDMVSSFNKDEMPEFVSPAISNSVKVENNGPNSRLDKVIQEQKKLNQSILKQTQQYNVGNKRVIRTGNKVRIIG